MAGLKDLDELLGAMRPELQDAEFVFCTVPGSLEEYCKLDPIATFAESEGLTLVIKKAVAEDSGFSYEGVYRQITLTVHSSLEAVGLTAAVAHALAAKGISANVVAAYYHDHFFVPADKAGAALSALKALSH